MLVLALPRSGLTLGHWVTGCGLRVTVTQTRLGYIGMVHALHSIPDAWIIH